MILILKLSILTSIWVLGLTIATQEGMIFHSVRQRAEKKNNPIYEPLILCHWCMPSLHALVGYLFGMVTGVLTLTMNIVLIYPLVVMLSSLVCGIIWEVYQVLKNVAAYYDHMETLAYWEVKEGKANYHNRKNNTQNGTEKKSVKRFKRSFNAERYS